MSRNRVIFIDLADEAAAENAYDDEQEREFELIDLTQDNDDNEIPQSAEAERPYRRGNKKRNLPLNNTHRSIQATEADGGLRVHTGDFVELRSLIGEWKIQFVEIKQIWVEYVSREVILRGFPYTRNCNVKGRLEFQINEVCQILELDDDDKRPDEQQAMVEIRPLDILRTREFHKTNADYTAVRNYRYGNDYSWRRAIPGIEDKDEAKRFRQENAPLTCRWKLKPEHLDGRFRKAGKPYGNAVIHLSESDIQDPEYRVSDAERRRTWRSSAGHSPAPGRHHQYTFGDAFSGAGGASSGARMAGFKPTIAIDNWATARATYQRNFRHVQFHQQDISDFIISPENTPHTDILHISPPCQYYSPARVNDGQNDEANRAATFSCEGLIAKMRPRIVTLEQTYGLLQQRYMPYFNKLVQSYTRLGYSIQWRNRVEFVQYGLPQHRKRLIIIACAPGESLPAWPAATHGMGNGLTPWVTEAQAIGRLPRNVTLHDERAARRVDGPARDPNRPLHRTIVCGGAQGVLHYSGQRDYTLREGATLQGFPLSHEFVGPAPTTIKKQIGNAFPPSVAAVFYRAVRESLEDQDRRRGLEPPAIISQTHALRMPGHQRMSSYSRLNGDISEDEALRVAMETSHRAHARQTPVIVLDSSDDDELPEQMGRLSVEPSLPLQPSTSNSSSSQQTASSWSKSTAVWSSLRIASGASRPARSAPSSAASSVTLGNSPSPSPSLGPAKRKWDALSAECHNKSKQRRIDLEVIDVDEKEDDDDSAHIMSRDTASSIKERLAASGRTGRRQTLSGLRVEDSLPPGKGHVRLSVSELTRLAKLRARRPTSLDWEF